MGSAFVQEAFYQYCRNGFNMFQISNLAERSQPTTLLETNNSGNSGLVLGRKAKKAVSAAVVVEEADKKDWDLDRKINPAEADENGFQRNYP